MNTFKEISYYELLPKFLKVPAVENNKLTLRFNNGSQAKAVASSPNAARSEAVSLLVIDEGAFIDNVEEMYRGAGPTISTGGRCVIISTPNGTGNWFYKMWKGAQNRENGYFPIKLEWFRNPDYKKEWADGKKREMGKKEVKKKGENASSAAFSPEGQRGGLTGAAGPAPGPARPVPNILISAEVFISL